MYVQGVDRVFDLNFNGRTDDRKLTYGDVFLQAEQEYSRFNFEHADTEILLQHFRDAEKECKALLDAGAPAPDANDKRHKLALPAYDQCIKASHIFNLLGRPRRDLRDRAAELHLARARAGQGLLRRVARDRRGRGVMQVAIRPSGAQCASAHAAHVHPHREPTELSLPGEFARPDAIGSLSPRRSILPAQGGGRERGARGKRRRPPWLSCCSSCSPRRSRRGCRGGRRRICARLVTEGLKAQGLEAGEAKALRDAAAADAGGGGRAGEVARPVRGAQGPARQCAGAGDRRVREVGRAQVDRGRHGRQGREEGRLLRRAHRQAGTQGGRDRRRGRAGGGGEVPLAQVDALGLGQDHLGAAAAFDRLPARRQGRAVRDRGRGERQGDARAPLPRQRAVRGHRGGGLHEGAENPQSDP